MKLPVLSAHEVIKILLVNGFKKDAQKGSHVKFKKVTKERIYVVTVPTHKEICPFVLCSIIRNSGLPKEAFC